MKEFFERHIEIITSNGLRCEECGDRLMGDFSEVAHILPKQKYKSIAKDDDAVIYLCGYRGRNCHGTFDNSSNKVFKKMGVYKKVSEIFEILAPRIKERIDLKTYERYTDDKA